LAFQFVKPIRSAAFPQAGLPFCVTPGVDGAGVDVSITSAFGANAAKLDLQTYFALKEKVRAAIPQRHDKSTGQER